MLRGGGPPSPVASEFENSEPPVMFKPKAMALGPSWDEPMLFLKPDKILRKGAAADVTLATIHRRAAQELWFLPLCHQSPGQKSGKRPGQAPNVSAIGLLIPIKSKVVLFCWYLGAINL